MEREAFEAIFYKGIENHFYFSRGRRDNLIRGFLKVLRLLLFRAFLGKKSILHNESVRFVWYPLHEKILAGYGGEKIVILDRKSNIDGKSFLQYISLFQCVRIVTSIPHSIIISRLSYEWCFYRLIAYFVISYKVKSITVAGHYDRNTTWIAYLAKELGICFTISQHGISSRYNIPHKIPVDRVEVFSKAEEDMFKSTVLDAQNTTFFIKEFKSSLKFTKGYFDDNTTVAIASQPGYEDKVIKIVEFLNSIAEPLNIIVYSHPSDRFRKGILNMEGTANIIHTDRYWNINYLIVFTSTLAYDYWSCPSFKGKVLCCYDESCIVSLYNDDRAVILQPETLENQLYSILFCQ